MKQSAHGFGYVSFMIAAPLLLIGVGLLIVGLRTTPDVLTQDGLSQRLLLLIGGAVFLVSGLGVVSFSLLSHAGSQVEAHQRQEREATHRKAVARVLKVQPGTKLGNEDWTPVLLTLEVVVPGRAPYEVSWDGEVEKSFSGQLRPNEWLRVLVSPSNSQDLDIRWGEPAEAPAP